MKRTPNFSVKATLRTDKEQTDGRWKCCRSDFTEWKYNNIWRFHKLRGRCPSKDCEVRLKWSVRYDFCRYRPIFDINTLAIQPDGKMIVSGSFTILQ